MRILHHNCDPEIAKDRSLPYTAYIVKYKDVAEGICYDIVISNRQVDIFDYYWDRYREDLISFKQSEGRTNPKLWEDPSTKKEKKQK